MSPASGWPFVLSLLFAGFGLGWTDKAQPAEGGGGAGAVPKSRQDSLGDPLPPGAVARLGTTRLRQFLPQVSKIAYSPKGDIVAAVCVGTLRRWETASGKQLAPVTSADEMVWSIAFFPDGKRLALAVELAPPRHGRFLRVLDLRTGTAWNTARRLLQELARGAEGAALTRDAKAAVARLERLAAGK